MPVWQSSQPIVHYEIYQIPAERMTCAMQIDGWWGQTSPWNGPDGSRAVSRADEVSVALFAGGEKCLSRRFRRGATLAH